ncbi:CHAT domain-containing protein [Parapedobacter sp. 2B3]|uniref:CHAT domain-containing protein n=1 Tax=Parapedobacter sp. 2B3 TaxID=3342381 RepID=UPI0035B5EFA4
MLRAALLFAWLLGSGLNSLVIAQESDYDAAIRTYRTHVLDSADYYGKRNIQRYRATGQLDSLAFSYVQQALVVWSRQDLEAALRLMDTAKRVADWLPEHHVARVAVESRVGQLLTQQYAFGEAAAYFERAERRIIKNVPPNRHYALLFNQIAVLYLLKEDFATADRYVELAYEMSRLLDGADGWDMVMILQTRFLISRYSGQFERALEDGKAFQRVVELRYPPGHPNIGSMHNSLAVIYEALNRYDEALIHRQKAVGIQAANYSAAGDGAPLAAAYQNLGYLYRYIQEPFLAQEYLDKGIRLLVQQHGPDGLGMVHPWAGLARLKNELGRFEEATEFYQKAYEVQQRHGPDDLLGMAFVESSLGDNYRDLQQYVLAESFYHQALYRYRQAGAMGGEDALHTQRGMSLAKSAMGQYEAAIALQEEVLAGFRKLFKPGNPTIAGMLLTLARIYREADSLERALAYADSSAMELARNRRLPENADGWFDYLPASRYTVDLTIERATILEGLYWQSHNRRYLEELLGFVDGYSAFMASNLHALRSQAALIDQADINKAIYSIAMEACWTLSDDATSGPFMRKAFAYAERSKALLLRLAANGALVDASQSDDGKATSRDRAFRQRINTLNLQYLNSNRDDSLLHLLSVTAEKYRLFLDSLKNANNELFAIRYTLEPPTPEVVREVLLEKNRALVEYAVTDRCVFVFVVTPSSFDTHRIDRQVLDEVGNLQRLYGLSPQAFCASSYRLYQALIEPIQSNIKGKKLLIVPDADLYYLNFEMLISDARELKFSEMPFLIRSYEVSYLLSAGSALQTTSVRRSLPKSGALLFAPVFSDEMKASYQEGLANPQLEDEDYLYLYRQPFALQAALRIAKVLDHDLYIEQDAEEKVFKSLAHDYRILHLGTHGEVNNDSPLLSRLFLAKSAGDSAASDDGYLHAYEIYGMQLRAELSVLTACETGMGALRSGEGLMSLAHSFQYAGCPSVVMSLWKIDEKASADIITVFYENLAKGQSKSTALRKAKLQLIRKGGERLAHPYYWAGLALIGDTKPLYPSYSWIYWVCGVATMVLLLIWVYRRRF